MKNKFLANADEALSAFRSAHQQLRYANTLYRIPRQKARSIYENGSNVKDLAGLYGCSECHMRRILHQAGAILRGSYRHDVPQGPVVKKYLEGMIGSAIAKEYGASVGTIYNRLDDAGVERRKSVAPRPQRKRKKINPASPAEAIAMYHKHGSVSRVAEELGICRSSANRLILEGGVKPQSGDYSNPAIKRVVHAYRVYGSIARAAKKIGCSPHVVYTRLLQSGEIEYNPRHPKLSDDNIGNVLCEFDSGESVHALSKEYRVNDSLIRRLLLANGREIRSRHKNLQAPLARLAKRHANGEPIYELAKAAGVCKNTLSDKLRAAGYKVNRYSGRNLPKSLITKICRRFETDCFVSKLVEETGYSAYIVSRVLRERGYEIQSKPNRRRFTASEEKSICEDYDDGTSIGSLKLTYGLKTVHPIRRVLVEHGYQIRTSQEQVELDRQSRLDKLLGT